MKTRLALIICFVFLFACSNEKAISPLKDTYNENNKIIKREFVTHDEKTHFTIYNKPELSKEKIETVTSELETAYKAISKYNKGYQWSKEISIYLKESSSNASYALKKEIFLYDMRGSDYQLTHELTHVMLGIGSMRYGEFDEENGLLTQEGFAVYLAEKIDPEKDIYPHNRLKIHKTMRHIIDEQETIPLESLAHNVKGLLYLRSNDPKTKWKAYIHAGSFIKYLFEKYPKEMVINIYNSPSLLADLKEITGKDIDTLESEWLNYVIKKYDPLTQEEKLETPYP